MGLIFFSSSMIYHYDLQLAMNFLHPVNYELVHFINFIFVYLFNKEAVVGASQKPSLR